MAKRFLLWTLVLILSFASLVFSQNKELTKEQIIKIAISKSEEIGYNSEEMDIVYDENNKKIKEHLMNVGVTIYNEETKKWDEVLPTTPEKEYPALAGKNYQSVYFGPKEMQKGGDLWIFIDRDTGEVIKWIGGE